MIDGKRFDGGLGNQFCKSLDLRYDFHEGGRNGFFQHVRFGGITGGNSFGSFVAFHKINQ